MSRRRKVLLVLLAGLILLASLLFLAGRQANDEQAARQKLDDMLGQDTPQTNPFGPAPGQAPPETQEMPALPPMAPPNIFGFKIPMPKAAVDVQETPQAYELRVPLADPKDASSIKLNVEPHHIEISGQTGSHEGGATVTSSFMQAFTTSQTVLPDKVSRRTEQHGQNSELVITIPKQYTGKAESLTPTPGSDLQNTQPAPPDNDPGMEDSTPYQGQEHKVI